MKPAVLVPDWRSVTGRPRAYTNDEQDRGVFQLIPTPFMATVPPTGPLPQQLPDDMVALFHTEYRENLYTVLELPTAFFTISREYTHAGPHQDPEVAMAAATLGGLLMHMIE